MIYVEEKFKIYVEESLVFESLTTPPHTISLSLQRNITRLSEVKVAQSCPALWDPMDYRVHGILQARILEWVAVPFSRGSSQPRDRTQVSRIADDSLPAKPQGKPPTMPKVHLMFLYTGCMRDGTKCTRVLVL